MTETQFKSIINNNLSAYKSGRKTREEVIESIIRCVFERPKINCEFGNKYCNIHKNDIKPCNKCRVAYEYELTSK